MNVAGLGRCWTQPRTPRGGTLYKTRRKRKARRPVFNEHKLQESHVDAMKEELASVAGLPCSTTLPARRRRAIPVLLCLSGRAGCGRRRSDGWIRDYDEIADGRSLLTPAPGLPTVAARMCPTRQKLDRLQYRCETRDRNLASYVKTLVARQLLSVICSCHPLKIYITRTRAQLGRMSAKSRGASMGLRPGEAGRLDGRGAKSFSHWRTPTWSTPSQKHPRPGIFYPLAAVVVNWGKGACASIMCWRRLHRAGLRVILSTDVPACVPLAGGGGVRARLSNCSSYAAAARPCPAASGRSPDAPAGSGDSRLFHASASGLRRVRVAGHAPRDPVRASASQARGTASVAHHPCRPTAR